MNNAYQSSAAEHENAEPFEDRIDILFRELELATKWKRPSVLFAIFSSEYVHSDAAIALENRLLDLGQRAYHIKLKKDSQADISSVISEATNLDNVIFFVEGLRMGAGSAGSEVYRALNNQREYYIDHQVRVVFWLTESEAIDLAHYASDYWAFRHRVIEFVDSPKPEQISPAALESAWQSVGELTDTSEDLDAKIALRTALLTDLPTGDESTAARANLVLTLGILHWRRGDYDRATQFLDTALDLASKLQDNCFEGLCHNAVALIETGLGRVEEAIQAYQRAIQLAPEHISPWNNLGGLNARLGKYPEALEAYQKAIEQNPADLTAWTGLGDVYLKLDRHDDAVYAFLKTLEFAPNHAPSWSGLGSAYIFGERLDDARAAHQKALELDRRLVASWLGLGEIYKRQGKLENSAIAFQTAIEVDPKNGQAWNALGDMYFEAKAFDEAARTYRKAVELGYASQASYSNLASIYMHKGQYTEAIPLLQKGIELLAQPADQAQLWNRLGDAYRRLNEYDNAVAAYKAADELNAQAASNAAAEAEPAPLENPVEPAAEVEPEGASPAVPEAEVLEPETAEIASAEPVASELDLEPMEFEPAAYTLESPETAGPEPAADPVENLPVEPAQAPLEDTPVHAAPALPTAEVDFAEWLTSLGAIHAEAEPAPVADLYAPEPAAPADQPMDLPPLEAVSTEPVQAVEAPEAAAPVVEPETLADTVETPAAAQAVPPELEDTQPVRVVHAAAKRPLPAKAPRLEPSASDARNAQIWTELGNIYCNSGAYAEAIHAFTQAVELDQTDGWAYNNLAGLYVHTGRFAEAIPLYLKGIKFLPEAQDKAALWNRVGDAYRRLGDHASASAAYQKAVELDPEHVSLLTRARFSLLGNCRAS